MIKESIRRKLILTYLSLIIVIMFFLGIYLSDVVADHYLQSIEAHLQADTLLTTEVFRGTLMGDGGDMVAIQEKVKTLSKGIGARITLIDSRGKVLADSAEEPGVMDNHLMRPEIQAALISGRGEAIRYSTTLNEDMKYLAVAVRDGEGVAGFIRLALPLSQVNEVLGRTRLAVGKSALLAIIFTLIAGSLMARAISRPLIEISEAATAIGQGELSRRIRVRGNDEISQLGEVINQMARGLQNMINQISDEKLKMEAVLAHMADGVVAVDGNGMLILLNATAEIFFGIQREWAMGRHVLEAIRNHELAEALLHAPAGGESSAVEIRLFTPAQRNLLCYVTPIKNPAGGGDGAVAVLQDVTELRKLERMRSDFVSNVSHELRTPVTSIKGFVDTLLDGAMSDPGTCEHFLKIIQRESDRLVRLLSDLLDLSRIESKRSEVILVPTDLRRVVEDSMAVVEGEAVRKGVKVECAISAELPRVMADPDMLAQVFINLLDNGVKYTPPGGRVEVHATPIDGGKRVEVCVADTGIGIPREHLPRIFERFYRVDKARSRQMGGTGLGLAIVKHIIDRHGSKITVESQEGKGTEFTFILPAAAEEEAPGGERGEGEKNPPSLTKI